MFCAQIVVFSFLLLLLLLLLFFLFFCFLNLFFFSLMLFPSFYLYSWRSSVILLIYVFCMRTRQRCAAWFQAVIGVSFYHLTTTTSQGVKWVVTFTWERYRYMFQLLVHSPQRYDYLRQTHHTHAHAQQTNLEHALTNHSHPVLNTGKFNGDIMDQLRLFLIYLFYSYPRSYLATNIVIPLRWFGCARG